MMAPNALSNDMHSVALKCGSRRRDDLWIESGPPASVRCLMNQITGIASSGPDVRLQSVPRAPLIRPRLEGGPQTMVARTLMPSCRRSYAEVPRRGDDPVVRRRVDSCSLGLLPIIVFSFRAILKYNASCSLSHSRWTPWTWRQHQAKPKNHSTPQWLSL